MIIHIARGIDLASIDGMGVDSQQALQCLVVLDAEESIISREVEIDEEGSISFIVRIEHELREHHRSSGDGGRANTTATATTTAVPSMTTV